MRVSFSRALTSLLVALSFCAVVQIKTFAATASPDGAVAGLKPKFGDVNGTRTRYYEMGQGETMLLIHGGGWGGSSNANNFSTVLPLFAKKYHVYAPDRLGHGLTDNPKSDKDYNQQGEVDFLYQFVQSMKLGKVHLIGHSSGGAIAFYLAIEHPEIVKDLVLIAEGPEDPSSGDGPTKLDVALQKCPKDPYYDSLKCRAGALAWFPTTFDEEYWQAAGLMGSTPQAQEVAVKLKAGAGEPQRDNEYAAWRDMMWDKVRNDGVLQMPVLLYAGKDDILDWVATEPKAMLRGQLGLLDIIGAKNPRVQMIVMNDAGHFMYREHPEQFTHDVIGFIDYWAHAAK
jgi:2-hydroxy-6-oxonona-2,4-dienedioate hydrolase